MTTAYWFDLDGTLIEFDRSFESLLEECVGAGLSTAAHETFRRALFVAFDSFDPAPYERGFEAMCAEHDLDVTPSKSAQEFRDLELAATELTADATTVLETVYDRYPTGILTNGDGEMQRAKIERFDLESLVDEIIISNEVEVRKPATGIFDIARERLPAETYVYIGDSYEEDIVGAQDAGFQAIHVRNDDGPIASVDRLGSLRQFLDLAGDTH